jgi:hypothetical protein
MGPVELALRNVAPSAWESRHLARFQHFQPRGRGVQFGLRAILPHSNTPSLRVAEFEDEDEYEAPSLLFQYLDSSALFGAKGGSGER